jgi:hypothetical protein
MALCIQSITSSFNTDEFDRRIFGEGVKHPDCVTAASDTSYDGIWQLPALLKHLLAGLVADYGLEGSDDCWEGVGADG